MKYVTAYGIGHMDKKILELIKENKVADAIELLKKHHTSVVGNKGIIRIIKDYAKSKCLTSTLGNLFVQDLVNYLTTDETMSFSKYHMADGGVDDKVIDATLANKIHKTSSTDEIFTILNKGSLEELFFITELIKKYITRS